MWTAVIAVLGTLAGAFVSGALKQRAARADREDVQAEQRRAAQIEAVTALASAVSTHRRAMWEIRDAQLASAAADRVQQLRDESHRTRSEITDPAVRVQLLIPDTGVRAAAIEAVQATYRMRASVDAAALQTDRAAALQAHDDLVMTAGRFLTA